MKVTFRLTLVVGFLMLSAIPAIACTCLQISHRQEFRRAEAVFVGTVTEVVEDTSFVRTTIKNAPRSIQKILDSQRRYQIRLHVERGYKGVDGPEFAFYQVRSDSDCSPAAFGVGDRLLVYAARDQGRWFGGGLCSRTQLVTYASKEIQQLGSFWFRLRARLPW